MKQHADYVTAETRRLTTEVTEATALQNDAAAQNVLNESRGLMLATSLFQEHVGRLIFPSQPLSPEISEKTLMDVRFGVVEAYNQVNAEVKRRLDSVQGTAKSIEAEKQNALKDNC
jgi:hypothetical protein